MTAPKRLVARRRRARGQRGFSAVELLLAITMLGILMLGFMSIFPLGTRTVRKSEKLSIATSLAQDELDPATTLCQRLAVPEMLSFADGTSFKADVRLFVYRTRLLGLTARLYRGQVTNMRTEGGGFAHVQVV